MELFCMMQNLAIVLVCSAVLQSEGASEYFENIFQRSRDTKKPGMGDAGISSSHDSRDFGKNGMNLDQLILEQEIKQILEQLDSEGRIINPYPEDVIIDGNANADWRKLQERLRARDEEKGQNYKPVELQRRYYFPSIIKRSLNKSPITKNYKIAPPAVATSMINKPWNPSNLENLNPSLLSEAMLTHADDKRWRPLSILKRMNDVMKEYHPEERNNKPKDITL